MITAMEYEVRKQTYKRRHKITDHYAKIPDQLGSLLLT